MKKLLVLLVLLVSGTVFSQKHEMIMSDFAESYAYSMNYDSLFITDFGNVQLIGNGIENKYVVDGTEMILSYFKDGRFIASSSLISFKETKDQVLFSWMNHGSISNKDYVRYGVYNKKPRTNEPKFVLYYQSKLDNITTVCHRTLD